VTHINAERRDAGILELPDRQIKREIIERSLEYGRLVRELEDFGYFAQRLNVRRGWKDFSNREIDKRYRLAAIDAYYDEYCREPTDEEYEEVERGLRTRYGHPSKDSEGSEGDKTGG
jgi:hypothetical protein